MVVLHARVQRKNLLLAKLQNAQSMENGVTGQSGASAARNVALARNTVTVRSKLSLNLVVNQSQGQRKKKMDVRISPAQWHAKCPISRTLVNAQSVAEVGR
jgi:hypothetical protein